MSEQAKQAIVLLGGGGHASVVLDSARVRNLTINGFYDDDPDVQLNCLHHLGDFSSLPQQCDAILCVGNLPVRKQLITTLRFEPVTVIHPSAIIAQDVDIHPGVFVGPRVVVNAGAKIGSHAILNSGCIVEHDVVIGTNTHIAPGAVLAGNVVVNDNTLVGVGARVVPEICIGCSCTIASGAVVIRDVESGTTVAGVPAIQLSS